MTLRLGPVALGCAATLLALTAGSNDAQACGGCFVPPSQTTVVSGHRMALSISPAQTVLWDQIEYSGDPQDFAWVLPIKPGAVLQVSNDAWFEALEAATATRVVAPQLNCPSPPFEAEGDSGCNSSPFGSRSSNELAGADSVGTGSGGNLPPPVDVVHQGTVGPYETVTLHANVQGALTTWLLDNDYDIDPDIQPIIDAYTAEGFDFIALRLAPDQGVKQMLPVRVVSPGAVPALPLRMVAAGTGANVALTLYVIGEGRWGTENFPGGTVDDANINWDFTTSASNYADVRAGVIGGADGRTWLTSYAKKGALLSNIDNPITGFPVQYQLSDSTQTFTIAETYVQQGLINGETSDTSCQFAATAHADSGDLVVNPCPSDGGACDPVPLGFIDARGLACGALDDLAVALTGMHPRDVWVNRLEADLPRAALASDLAIEASAEQVEVENWLPASTATNEPCPIVKAGVALPPSKTKGDPGDRKRRNQVAAGLTLLFAASMLARRALRRRITLGARPVST